MAPRQLVILAMVAGLLGLAVPTPTWTGADGVSPVSTSAAELRTSEPAAARAALRSAPDRAGDKAKQTIARIGLILVAVLAVLVSATSRRALHGWHRAERWSRSLYRYAVALRAPPLTV